MSEIIYLQLEDNAELNLFQGSQTHRALINQTLRQVRQLPLYSLHDKSKM